MNAQIQKDSCYFSHDANAKDDYKCMLLIDQMGLEGYGIFWVLIETLREQKDYKYPLQLVPSLARKYNTTQAKMETVINAYGLFELDTQSFFFSGSLNRRMSFFEQKKLQQIEAGKRGVAVKKAKQKQLLLELSEDNSTNRPLNDPQAIKRKEIKEKEKKEIKEEFEKLKNLAKNLTVKEKSRLVINELGLQSFTITAIINNKGLINVLESLEISSYDEYYLQELQRAYTA